MILRLSEIWDLVRFLHGESSSRDSSPGVDAQNIVRKTTKYWVHPGIDTYHINYVFDGELRILFIFLIQIS